MKFAERLKRRRREKGLTQKDLADFLDVSHTTVSKWENGVFDPDTETLKKMARYLNVSVDYLVGNDEEEEESKIIDILEEIQKNPSYIRDPKTGRLITIGETEARIIKDILIGYLKWKDDNLHD